MKDIKVDGLDVTGIPHIYLPLYQVPGRRLSIVLRTSQPATILEPQIRREVQRIDPGLPVFNVASMTQVLDRSVASRRFAAELVGTFAGLALLLTSVGIYGLLAYMVGQRSREIGLRMALGAGRGNIAKLVLSKGLVLGLIGIGTGALFSISASSLLATLLYSVQPHDPTIQYSCQCLYCCFWLRFSPAIFRPRERRKSIPWLLCGNPRGSLPPRTPELVESW